MISFQKTWFSPQPGQKSKSPTTCQLNTMDQSKSELQVKISPSFSILDPQTYGFHPKNVGYPLPVGYTTTTTKLSLKLMLPMEQNSIQNMVLEPLKDTGPERLSPSEDLKLNKPLSDKSPHSKESHSISLNLMEFQDQPGLQFQSITSPQSLLKLLNKDQLLTTHSHSS